MKVLRRFLIRLVASITRGRGEARLDEEVQEHLALQTAQNIAAGMSPAEARRQAVLKFGAVEVMKEQYRDQRSLVFVESLFRDVLYTVRQLRRNPGFAVIVVLTLALGIGANTAIFSIVDGVLLRPTPFERMDRLVMVWQTDRNSSTVREPASLLPDKIRSSCASWIPRCRSSAWKRCSKR